MLSPTVDSVGDRLRQYVAVPSDVSPVSASMAVDIRTFPWIRRLASDYAFAYANVSPFFAGDPATPAAWADTITRSQAYARQPAEIARILAAQQELRGAPAAARASAARLADPATRVVITGQQAGVFGGPLFTLLKALTALQLARRTERDLKVPVVTVFWVDAEDHDWPEVRSCTVLDAEFQPRTVTLADLEGAGELPIAQLALDARVEDTIAELASSLHQTEFTSQILTDLRAAWKPGTGMARAFATWIETLLGPHGLVVFESADPNAKPLAADVFATELSSPGRTAALAAQAGEALAARGHAPQVVPNADSVSLFRLNGGRTPIKKQGDQLVIGETTHSSEELAREATGHPERFSPNVLLRPLVQDTLFPTICYVPGPSELAYLGQLRGVYDAFGVPMPLFFPRTTATLLDSGATRFLEKYAVPFFDLRTPDESALNKLLEAQLPASVEESLRDAATQTQQAMARVVDALPSLDPTLAGAAKTTLGKMEHELRSLHSKVIHAAKKRDETLRRQFVRAQAQAFPHGHPQERTLGVVYFLNKYGPGLVDLLLEELPVDPGQHWLITL